MTSTKQIRNTLASIPDDTLRDVSLCLLDRLVERIDDRSTMWTYAGLANLVGRQADDSVVHRCIEVLSSRPSAKLLEMHFMYFDPTEDDSRGELISDEEVARAFVDGYLVDPQDGRQVQEFMSVLAPYFQIARGIE